LSTRVGFSLLELIAVMVIVAAVLAIAMPRMRGFFASRHLEHAATELLALTRYARTMAVSLGRPYRLNIDGHDHKYFLTTPGEQGYEQPANDFGRTYEFAKGIEIEWIDSDEPSKRGYLEFWPDGQVDVATLRLTDRHENVMDVRSLSPSESFQIDTPAEDER